MKSDKFIDSKVNAVADILSTIKLLNEALISRPLEMGEDVKIIASNEKIINTINHIKKLIRISNDLLARLHSDFDAAWDK
jgi:hypothetical protein